MARTGMPQESDNWEIKFREDEEMEFFTELALHETERWIQAVTRMKFPYPDDPRKSLEDGILLCELLNCIKNSSVKRINRQAAPIAGLDNINVFLNACRSEFGLYETQLFNPADLEDLSHRAIADSDQLKQESDRRLRKVAITIYCLGRVVAEQNYPVPVLDFSAFTPLINHNAKDIISNDHIYKLDHSWDHSCDHSSAYGSNGFSRSVINQSYDSNHNHFRDSSYESYASYGKGSEESLDDPNYSNMPVGKRYSAANDSVYREDKYNGMYRSSPDLAVPSFNHRRSSSTDSLDGSYRGSHSRQSSDSWDGYPTRSLSRRTSSSIADPLQFIKSKGAEDMAKQATETIKQVEETKKLKTPSISESSKEDEDWQSSLGDWKSRRKSRSEAFQIKEEQEEQEKKKQEAEQINKSSPIKSYKQIQEERERRKSGSNVKSFYPVDDDDDDEDGDDAFISPIKSSTTETVSSSFSKIKSSTPSNKSIPWTQDTESDLEESGTESDDKNNSQTFDNNTKDSSNFNQSNNSMHNLSHNSNNISNYSDKSRSMDSDRDMKGVSETVKQRNSRNNDLSSANKINNIRNKFESPSDKPVSRTTVFDAKVDLKERKKSFEIKSSDSDIGRPPKPYPRERGGSNQVTAIEETTPPVYTSSKVSSKDYVEKNIKITSKHNNSGGFGFIVSGGTDRKQPVIVERVSLEKTEILEYIDDCSAADICELKSKDEILLVNKQEVARLTNQDVNDLIQQAAKQGSIEIRVKRFLDSNAEDSDEFLSSDEEESTKKQSQSRETTHSFDSTLSQDEDPPLYNNNNNVESKSNGKIATSQISSEYSEQPLMQQLKNDASLQRQFDQQNDSSYQSAENISQSYSSYGSSNNASSLDNSDYTTNPPVSYAATNPEQVKSENTYVRTRISHHDYVNTSSLDSWGYGNHDNQQEQEVVMRRKKQSVEESVASSSSFDEADRVRSPDVGSSDSDGPPAILRKWQRQRPTSEYKIQDEKSLVTPKRLSATLPWQPEHLGIEDRPDDPVLERARRDFTDTVSNQPIPSPRSNQIDVREDRKRIREWNHEQEQKRQPDDLNAAVVNNNQSFNDQVEFEANREQMSKQYEEDQKRASQVQQQNEMKERELLEPEMERMRISEERRQERRKRLLELNLNSEEQTTSTVSSQPIEITETRATLSYNTQDNSRPINSSTRNFYPIESSPHPSEITQTRSTISYSAPQHHTYQNVYEPNYVNQPTSDVSTMNIHVAEGRPVQISDPNQPNMSYMLPSNQSSGLIIDPRNRLNESEPVPQYSIQLNLNQRETQEGLVIQPEIRSIPVHDTNFIEQEKEKIRLEYLKFEETFRKQQDEEDRKFQEREQKLREQEEKLRKEEERLRREEEILERERENLRKSTEFSQPKQSKFHDPVPTRVRGQSALYKSSVSAPNRKEPKPKPSTYSTSMVIDNNHSNRHNVNKVEPTWPPKSRQPGNISVKSHDQWSPGGKTYDVKNVNSAKRPNDFPSKDHHGDVQSLKSRFSEPGNRKSWSREDMMAMNRKATPLQSKPDSSPTSPSSTGPVKREIPTRQEIHSLNAVPKPKLRQSVDWIERSEQVPVQRDAARRSDMMKTQYSDPLKGHWLIEEAERRRMNSDVNVKSSTMPIQPGSYNGPIKPPRDPNNVWSDSNPNMQKQIRQTLLQKTANVRGSGVVNPQDIEPQITRNPYLTQTMPPPSSSGYGGYNSPRNGANLPLSTSVPTPTNQGPVSGKQLCSACHEELGFGAAMIIEKLGLYYHMPCFKCCVCRMPLGNGVEGADVRIRVNKLHCPNCYSNDEGTQHG